MRKIVEKKSQPRKPAPAARKGVRKREIEPASHVIERKPKKRPAKPTKTGKTIGGKKKTTRASRSSSSSRKAKTVGRTVGKVLGRAIGTVERALTRIMPSTDTSKK